jgi:hypothetical protein
VLDSQILTQLVIVEYADGNREAVGIEDVQVIKRPEKTKDTDRQAQEDEPDNGEEQQEIQDEENDGPQSDPEQ